MTDGTGADARAKVQWQGFVETAKQVITNPAGFYRGMAKGGGFGEPLVFLVVMAAVSGAVNAVLGLVHLSASPIGVGMALGMIIVSPIMAAIFGFVGAAIMFVIWKLMGSAESYETAYRCMAYSAAIAPITAVLSAIPYAGPILALLWGLYLVVTASVEVHKIKAQTAWLVFGIIAAIYAFVVISGQMAARRLQKQLSSYGIQSSGKPGEEMTPEDAGKAAAAFLKGMQEEAARQAAKEAKE